MRRVAQLVILSAVAIAGVLMLNGTMASISLAQGQMEIEGRVTGIDSTANPPILTVTTTSGTGYVLQAPSFSSVAAAQLDSRFRATGSVVGGRFIATSIQFADADTNLPPRPLVGGTNGVITGVDTTSALPRITMSTGAGELLVILARPDRVSELQIGAPISVVGSSQGGVFQASDFQILDAPASSDSFDAGDDNDNDDDENDDGDNDNDSNDDQDNDNS